MRDVLISGLPGTGKTSFGNWLQERHGYAHIDMESFQDEALHGKWKDSLVKRDFREFAFLVRAAGRPVVLSWGFPPEFLWTIRALNLLGFMCFWFDAPEMLARDVILKRTGAIETEFDHQVSKIRATQKELLNFYDQRCVSVVLGRGRFREREDVFDQMRSSCDHK
jgi:hypothetical protein